LSHKRRQLKVRRKFQVALKVTEGVAGTRKAMHETREQLSAISTAASLWESIACACEMPGPDISITSISLPHESPLICAIRDADVGRVKNLIALGADVNKRTQQANENALSLSEKIVEHSSNPHHLLYFLKKNAVLMTQIRLVLYYQAQLKISGFARETKEFLVVAPLSRQSSSTCSTRERWSTHQESAAYAVTLFSPATWIRCLLRFRFHAFKTMP
jgi:hypothetical protein